MAKKAVSQVITIILLILIVFFIIGIIWVFISAKIQRNAEEVQIKNELSRENLEINSVIASNDEPDKLTLALGKGPGEQVKLSDVTLGKKTARDIVLVTDVSGSMEWCKSQSEAISLNAFWKFADTIFCGERWVLTSSSSECSESESKIQKVKEAERKFVEDVFRDSSLAKIGLVEYSSPVDAAEQTKPDLVTSFYIGPTPSDCYLASWYLQNLDDSQWVNYDASVAPGNCEKCKVYLRKKFSVEDVSKVYAASLELAHSKGVVCFINGKEVAYNPNARSGDVFPVSSDVLVNGDNNVLACSVATESATPTSNWKFDASLSSSVDTYISKGSSDWKVYTLSGCSSYYGPKNFSVFITKNTNFIAIATVKNQGIDAGSFIVSLYDSKGKEIDKNTVSGLKTGQTVSISFNFNEIIPSPGCSCQDDLKYSVKADSGVGVGQVDEFDETNNAKEIPLDLATTPLFYKDLVINKFYYYNFDKCKEGYQDVYFNTSVKNQGNQKVTESFYVCLYDKNNNEVGRFQVNGGIDAGKVTKEYSTLLKNLYFSNGDFMSLRASADCGGNVDEFPYESNNDKSTPLSTDISYDFALYSDDIYLGSTLPCEDGTYYVTVYVTPHSIGKCNYNGDVDVSLYAEDGTHSAQSSGGKELVTFYDVPVTISGGSFASVYLSAEVNSDKTVSESNPYNNWDSNYFYPADCPCDPNCYGKECGYNDCGQSCGICDSGESCNYYDQCIKCTPRTCSDSQCGGSYAWDECSNKYSYLDCGGCDNGQVCDDYGWCCTPSCDWWNECGDDGCGGTCGSCNYGQTCNNGECCTPKTCDDYSGQCGSFDDSCGETLTCSCPSGKTCNSNTRQCESSCVPSCAGKQCGDNGCGGTCGSCNGQTCNENTGQCCTPKDCYDYAGQCGSFGDSCGGTVTCDCNYGQICNNGQCEDNSVPSNYKAKPINSDYNQNKISYMSLLPLPSFYDMLGYIGTCSGPKTAVFSGGSIVREYPLSKGSSKAEIQDFQDFINDAQAWSGTCICCGLNKAMEMLKDSSAEEKVIVILSDGMANYKCEGFNDFDGKLNETASDAQESAIASAEEAKKRGITIYSIGFGVPSSKGGDLDVDTLKDISGEENYHEAIDAKALAGAFADISAIWNTKYLPVVFYSYLKVLVITTDGETYNYNEIEASELPAPLESKDFKIDLTKPPFDSKIQSSDVQKIQIYPVAKDSDGQEVIGELVWEWEKQGEY